MYDIVCNRAERKDINDVIDEWHITDTPLLIYEYLGMSKDEYSDWILTGNIPSTLQHIYY